MVATVLLLLASATFLVAFWMYNKGVILGKNLPAFAAWGLFSLITLINCLTYLTWTASIINIAVLLTDFVICVGTTLIVLVRLGGRVQMDEGDKWITFVSLVAVLLWVLYRTAAGGNLINQIAYCLAFIPTYRNVLRDSRNEPTKPWLLWTIAFVMNVIALTLQPKTQLMDYVSPIICFVHHAAITTLSLRKPQPIQMET